VVGVTAYAVADVVKAFITDVVVVQQRRAYKLLCLVNIVRLHQI
jgi:hypothetical protein